MLQAGESQNHVARFFGKLKSVISQLAALYRQIGDVKMRTGHGQHRKTNFRQDRFIRVIALCNRFVTAPELKQELHTATGLRISNSTVHRRLCEVGLKARRPFCGVIMTQANRRTRLQLCQQHQG